MFRASLLLFISVFGVFSAPDYYWRRYNGDVPEDAVVGGTAFGYNTYIGRAPFERRGVLIGTIYPGLNYIIVSYDVGDGGTCNHKVDDFVEILCTAYSTQLTWVTTTANTLLSHGALAEGGFQQPTNPADGINGVLYIGRILYEDQYVTGKVVGYHIGEDQNFNVLTYTNGTHGISASDYEVLTYE